ncbi:MAG: sigma-70 family RNA polymerase sigma factor [Desulfobacteraceae bacterium]|nr:sigma-70 family RNA polymerase sigma factor [Desulfobacteraceae bacterium]
MDEVHIPIELISQAQLGKKDSLDRLVGMVWAPLKSYVYRRTLDNNLTEDIVQESILELIKIIDRLQRKDRFWPWLCKIALNKIRIYNRSERRKKTALMSKARWDQRPKKYQEENVAELVNEELKQSVVKAMRQLKLRHREILALRCYESKSYSQIADEMDCTELGARLLFFRAKKSLAKELARNGLGRGSLLLALVIIGKMTAPTKAAAAGVSITAGTMYVGTTVSVIGAAISAKGIAVLTAGAITVSSVVVGPKILQTPGINRPVKANQRILRPPAKTYEGIEECCYFFPEGIRGPVMIRQIQRNEQANKTYCRQLQNDSMNYYTIGGTVFINNHRMWAEDISVHRLPTDSKQLREFLSHVEGKAAEPKYVPCTDRARNLLVTVRRDAENNNNILETVRHYNVVEEEFFQYDWPEGTKKIDNRDAMHKRGWTYFKIAGRINGEEVLGYGRIPFVYETYQSHSAWIRLKVGKELEIVDSANGANIYSSTQELLATYTPGTFMKGLARPWMGLHTIDTIRRDAAEKSIWFESSYSLGKEKAEVTLIQKHIKLIYSIDMKNDIVEKITFIRNDKNAAAENTLQISYLQDINQTPDEFNAPKIRINSRLSKTTPGIQWLFQLAEGTLVR